MSFLHPFLLWGTLLGSIPIIIHLLSRRRYKIIRWAAVDFLLKALSERSRNVRIQDLILLALRCLALVVAALAIARPILAPDAAGALGGSTDAVFIVDTSYSMGMGTTQSRLDVMKTRAREVLAALPANARVGVITMTRKAQRQTDGLTDDRTHIGALLGGLEVEPLGTNALPALEDALALLEESAASSKKVYLFTDAQASAFAPHEEQIRQLLEQADPSIGFLIIRAEETSEPNVAITGLDLESRWLRVGAPAEFKATFRDWSGVSSTTEAELWVDGRKVSSETVSLENGEATTRFRHTFTTSGLFPLEVRLAPDGIATDNDRHLAVYVPATMDVLVVGGQDHGDQGPGAYVFIEAALAGGGGDEETLAALPPFNVRSRISPDRLAGELDADVWTVILADPGALPADALRALSTVDQRGGSILIASGPEAVTSLGPLRSGQPGPGRWLLGIEFQMPDEPADENAEPEPLTLRLEEHSAERELQRFLDLDSPGVQQALASVRVFRTLDVSVDPDAGWIEALTLSNDLPLLLLRDLSSVEHQSTQEQEDALTPPSITSGRLAWLTSTLDPRWNDLVYRPAVVPLLHDVLGWLNRPQLASQTILPQQIWRPGLAEVPEGLRIATPDERMVDAAGFITDGEDRHASLAFDLTSTPGVYRLAGMTGGEITARQAVAVNVDTAESDPATWSRQELSRLFPADRFDVVSAASTLEGSEALGLSGQEIWWLAIALLAGMLLLETVLAHLFTGKKTMPQTPGVPSTAISGGAV